jgi:hypothetical protein
MTSLTKAFRKTVVTLAAAGTLIPSSVWAKGPGGISSRISGHASVSTGINNSAGSFPFTHKPTGSAGTSSSTGSTTISHSNGMASDKISSLSVSSAIVGNSSGSSPLTRKPISSASSANSTAGAVVHDANVRVPVYRSMNVDSYPGPVGEDGLIVLNGFFEAFTVHGSLQRGAEDPTNPTATEGASAPENNLTDGQNDSQYQDGGVMGSYQRNPDGSAGQPVGGPPISMSATAPGSSKLASTANSNAKFVNQASYLKNNPMTSTAANQAAKEWNASHIAGQVAKGDQTNTAIARLHQGPVVVPPKQQPIEQPKPLPMPSYPIGSVFGGGNSDGVSPAVYTSDESTSATAAASTTTPTADTGIDLVLEDVKLASPATLVAGPAYTVTFRNQGTANAGKFLVSIAAGFNSTIKANDPRVKVDVPALAAGEVRKVTLRLPQKAMRVDDIGRGLAPFRYLLVAIDPTNAVTESDKTNNTAILERAALEATAAN